MKLLGRLSAAWAAFWSFEEKPAETTRWFPPQPPAPPRSTQQINEDLKRKFSKRCKVCGYLEVSMSGMKCACHRPS